MDIDPIVAWAQAYDPDIDVSLDSDEDGDGTSLLLEFAFDMNPLEPDAESLDDLGGLRGLPTAAFGDGASSQLTGEFVRRRDHDTIPIHYHIEVGFDLEDWDEIDPGAATPISDDYERVSFTADLPVEASRYFFRIRVVYTP